MNEELPKPIHPWQLAFQRKQKLKEAKKIGKRRREVNWHREHKDELQINLDRQRERSKRGITIDLPKMKPWDYAKGRVK